MCVDGKKVPVKTIPGGDKEELWRGVNSRMIDLIYCKNFCK
jgi:hypothetical protein